MSAFSNYFVTNNEAVIFQIVLTLIPPPSEILLNK
jgi:hypothetical protein